MGIFRAPHRFFFFAGVVSLLLASAWWAGVLLLRWHGAAPPLGGELASVPLHAFLMLYGFFPFFIFGFLLTAGPRWLATGPPPSWTWVGAGLVAAVAAAVYVPASAVGPTALGALVIVHAACWAWLLAVFTGLIVASRAPDRTHAILVAAFVAVGLLGEIGMAWRILTGDEAGARAMQILGLWGFLVPVFCTVSHRMLPHFTAGVVAGQDSWRPRWVLAILVSGSLLHGTLVAAGAERWLWVADGPLAFFVLALAVQWGLVQSLRHRLLAMLHLSFLWLGISLALHGAQSMARLAGQQVMGLAPIHALTIGFLASIAVAMVSRVSRGHSGRPLTADHMTWIAFLVLQAAAILRVAADLWPMANAKLLAAAVFLWLASFLGWSWRYLPIYWLPRVDGRPG